MYPSTESESLFTTLAAAIRDATAAHYRLLRETYSAQELYGYSLYTEDAVGSFVPVANTVSQIAVDASDPLYDYYRYGPQEWTLWDDHGLFDRVNALVAAIHADHSIDRDAKRTGVLGAAFEALTGLESEGLFGSRSSDRFVVLWIADSDDPIMIEAAEQLNGPRVFAEFSREYGDG